MSSVYGALDTRIRREIDEMRSGRKGTDGDEAEERELSLLMAQGVERNHGNGDVENPAESRALGIG